MRKYLELFKSLHYKISHQACEILISEFNKWTLYKRVYIQSD